MSWHAILFCLLVAITVLSSANTSVFFYPVRSPPRLLRRRHLRDPHTRRLARLRMLHPRPAVPSRDKLRPLYLLRIMFRRLLRLRRQPLRDKMVSTHTILTTNQPSRYTS